MHERYCLRYYFKISELLQNYVPEFKLPKLYIIHAI